MNVEIIKNHVCKESHVVFSQEPKLDDSRVLIRESERLSEKYPKKQPQTIERFDVYWSKISPPKIGVPLKTKYIKS